MRSFLKKKKGIASLALFIFSVTTFMAPTRSEATIAPACLTPLCVLAAVVLNSVGMGVLYYSPQRRYLICESDPDNCPYPEWQPGPNRKPAPKKPIVGWAVLPTILLLSGLVFLPDEQSSDRFEITAINKRQARKVGLSEEEKEAININLPVFSDLVMQTARIVDRKQRQSGTELNSREIWAVWKSVTSGSIDSRIVSAEVVTSFENVLAAYVNRVGI